MMNHIIYDDIFANMVFVFLSLGRLLLATSILIDDEGTYRYSESSFVQWTEEDLGISSNVKSRTCTEHSFWYLFFDDFAWFYLVRIQRKT
jgi:hypothetical protein